MAQYYILQGDYKNAIEFSTTAIEYKHEIASSYLVRGIAHRNNGNINEALSDLQKAISINRQFTKAYITMGNTLMSIGLTNKDLPYYTEALKQNPSNKKIKKIVTLLAESDWMYNYISLTVFSKALISKGQHKRVQTNFRYFTFLRAGKYSSIHRTNAEESGGVMHSFVEDWNTAKAAMDMNFHIYFSGIVTFNSAKELKVVAKKMPLDRMLVETDAPYLAPVPYRGKSNQPAYVRYVAEHIAELRNTDVESIAEATTDNYFKLFSTAKRSAILAV